MMLLSAIMPVAFMASGSAGVIKPDCTAPVTQTDMTICAVQDFNEADRLLNAQWKITAAHMKAIDEMAKEDDGDPTYFQALLNAQRAWLQYRDSHCMTVGFYARGGSMQPMLVALCRAELTQERTKQIKALTEQ
ncbi:MAG: DUF1311 domain-containing protein [Sphingobium sp.]|nr:DUF1311 domain-containing protein [Sphingobium sp.]